MSGQEIVAEARRWIGTPFVHQASCRGAGCDCLGLVTGVWRALYGELPEHVPPYTPDWSEAAREETLLVAARRLLVELDGAAAGPGDVILFRMREGAIAKHLGILSGAAGAAPAFIHAYSGHGVLESPLSAPWHRRIVGFFRFP